MCLPFVTSMVVGPVQNSYQRVRFKGIAPLGNHLVYKVTATLLFANIMASRGAEGPHEES